jgi:hypothetical protein
MNKIATPSPLLNYTLRYNMLKDNMELAKVRDIATAKDIEKEKIVQAQSTRRFDQDRDFQQHIQEIKRYESLKLTKEYQEYQYQYNLGTKVDKYI